MQRSKWLWTDEEVEQAIGNVLRFGVIAAAAVVLIGGILYLVHHGMSIPMYHTFNGEPDYLRTLPGILRGAVSFDSRAVIQLGLLLLLATPVVRVLLSMGLFALQRDRLYVVVTLIVFSVLMFSLFHAA